jgi:integrase
MAKAIQGRGARDIAKRALETTGQIFGYAIAQGYAEHNPAKQFKPSAVLQSAPKTNYAPIDAKELPALLKRIEVYQGAPAARLAIKLIALTFVRTTELIEAKWSEFDLEAGRWDLPAARMKMRTPHISFHGITAPIPTQRRGGARRSPSNQDSNAPKAPRTPRRKRAFMKPIRYDRRQVALMVYFESRLSVGFAAQVGDAPARILEIAADEFAPTPAVLRHFALKAEGRSYVWHPR